MKKLLLIASLPLFVACASNPQKPFTLSDAHNQAAQVCASRGLSPQNNATEFYACVDRCLLYTSGAADDQSTV
jgi:hypothetical protein